MTERASGKNVDSLFKIVWDVPAAFGRARCKNEMTGRHEIDAVDARILRALQRDSSRPIADLAAKVGLSPSACHRRVKLLEQAGVIAGYAARLDRRALGLPLDVIVEIGLATPDRRSMEAFETAAGEFDDILECQQTSGGADYLLRVAVRDMADFARIHRDCLASLPGVARIQPLFVLSTPREWRGYPVPE